MSASRSPVSMEALVQTPSTVSPAPVLPSLRDSRVHTTQPAVWPTRVVREPANQ